MFATTIPGSDADKLPGAANLGVHVRSVGSSRETPTWANSATQVAAGCDLRSRTWKKCCGREIGFLLAEKMAETETKASPQSPTDQMALVASAAEIAACSIQNWYPAFARNTIKTSFIPLSHEFLEFLLADGIVLPKELSSDSPSYLDRDELSDDEDLKSVSSSDADEPIACAESSSSSSLSKQDSETEVVIPSFHALHQALGEELQRYDNKAFVKLNWTCLSDAKWINRGTLACTTPEEVYLLLKSSTRASDIIDYCRNHLTSSEQQHPDVCLVVRKWANLFPSMEFRCFVKHRTVIGTLFSFTFCQR